MSTEKKFKNLLYIKLLLSVNGIGTQKSILILEHFNELEKILSAKYSDFVNLEGINRTLAYRILAARDNFSAIESSLKKETARLSNLNGFFLTYLDEDYPIALRNIYLPPLIIFVKGNLLPEDDTAVAVVGTRQPSSYGISMTEKVTKELVEKKITIISGMARGIDSIAHAQALNYGGRTVAVIGSGLDVIYPPENKKLFDKICENGAVITEYELGTKPDAQNFPRRNRIISGLSLGTVVIETKVNGGAMQTASYAFDQGREVFAFPGNITTKQSEGPNYLIQKNMAKLITCADDILYELKLKLKPEMKEKIVLPQVELTLFEEKIFNILSSEPKYIDDIAEESRISIAECLVSLLSLEFKGLIKQLPGKMFAAIYS